MTGDAAQTVARISPGQEAWHRNFLSSARALRLNLVQTIDYLGLVCERNKYKMLGFGGLVEYSEKTAGFHSRLKRPFWTSRAPCRPRQTLPMAPRRP